MKKILSFSICFLVLIVQVPAQIVSFYKEIVNLELDSAHLTVNAELYFRNNYSTPASPVIFFPYSCKGNVVKVDSIRVEDMSNNHLLRLARKTLAGVMFQLDLGNMEQKRVHVTYIQDHDGKEAGYVLTKIKYWNEPLNQGNYALVFTDPRIIIDSVSYKPDNIIQEEGKNRYTWKKNNFSPDRELYIYFHRNKK
ncbi:MAG: hypothetical protein Q8867_04610 [Bacteroidota bacterium]|nr:hypothetical protein [Bacteroidota bacterium]